MKICKLGGALLLVTLLVVFSSPVMADNFNAANYSLSLSNSNGSVLQNGTSGFTLFGGNFGGCCTNFGNGNTTYSTTFSSAGNLSFNWNAHSYDQDGFSFDPTSIDLNGVTMVFVNSGYNSSGSLSFSFNAGDVLRFNVFSVDGCCGPGSITISSYDDSTAVPEPGSLVLLGTGLVGLGGSIRRRLSL